MLKEIVKPAVVLFLVCAIITGALAFVNGITKPIIDEGQEAALRESLSVVLPGAGQFSEAMDRDSLTDQGYQPGERIKNLYTSTNGGEIVGCVVEVASKGYGGNIVMLVGIDKSLSITGVAILSHNETPGLGSKADGEYMERYLGRIAENLYRVVKTKPARDGDIEALASATITSRAIANGISEAADLVRDYIRGEE